MELYIILQSVKCLQSPYAFDMNTNDNGILAFNAALVIVGCMVVAWKDRDDSPSTWDTVDKSRGYIEKAILALGRLDSGNRVIARCVEYLSQLVLILDTLSKLNVPFRIGGNSLVQLRLPLTETINLAKLQSANISFEIHHG